MPKGLQDINIFDIDILDKIKVRTLYHPGSLKEFFIMSNLDELGNAMDSLKSDNENILNKEWRDFKSSIKENDKYFSVGTIPEDIKRFKNNLRVLENDFLNRTIMYRDKTLEDMVLQGQELLRRKYFAILLSEGKKVIETDTLGLIIKTGAKAIQLLGRAPAPPIHAFKKFNSDKPPLPSTLGIEILSSGAFPDWDNQELKSLKAEGKINTGGFDNVIEAVLGSPRAKVIARLIRENYNIHPLRLPNFLRMMLDLELMRLGQATTPGTFKMLLNSFYYGALIVDHSTNVSEQVQIIYAEENWKPAFTINKEKSPISQSKEAAKLLLTDFFKLKSMSNINRDHKRNARIEFSDDVNPETAKEFFKNLYALIDGGIVLNGKKLKRNPSVHIIQPVLRLNKIEERVNTVKKYINAIKESGLKELLLIADFTLHSAGVSQYFEDGDSTNNILDYAKSRRVKLTDGKSVDMIATSNKAIEASAGAIESGQGCVKVGLFGLTYEQMFDFIKQVKTGLQSSLKREKHQLLVFIGLIDEPVVTKDKVIKNGFESSELFIDLMRRTQHDILLLDTMRKGKNDKRFVSEKGINPQDTKGGHLTFAQLKSLIAKSNKARCELWVAGSYTEEQVYQASLEPHKYRPGLICLGGAERSFGGIRLDPGDAYETNSRNKDEKKLAALVQIDSDIKFTLSRENKLARDAGHVEGELRRKGRKEAAALKKMRIRYLALRNEYFNEISKLADKYKIQRKNLDFLINNQCDIIGKASQGETNKLKKLNKDYNDYREKYTEEIANGMYDLFKKEWVSEPHKLHFD
ncbi:MAG: hypothetical protein PHN88_15005 [Ignavibacteria bacterium]|nr:hypothetical protein [Ignavibacteria bacterium]